MKQHGFTIFETMVVVGVIGLLAPVLAGSIRQMNIQTVRNSTGVRALTSIENVGRWLGQDVPLAQATDLADGSSAFTLQLGWTNWSDDTQYDSYSRNGVRYKRHIVTYSLSGSVLQRQYSVCSNWDLTSNTCLGTWTNRVSNVARDVTTINFSRSGVLLTIDVTSYPKGSAMPGKEWSYRVYALLLGSGRPV